MESLRPTTQSKSGVWLYEDLYRTEAKWYLSKIPDHNDKGNSKCQYVPGLLAKEYHETNRFAAALELEKNFDRIMSEVEPFILKNNRSFRTVGANTADSD